jgi:hypothetical protein
VEDDPTKHLTALKAEHGIISNPKRGQTPREFLEQFGLSLIDTRVALDHENYARMQKKL